MVKCIRWNSLDSTSKFYTESDCAENGQVTADRDETGEISAEYEYVDGTNVVNTVKYPNGSKFAYGRNPNNFKVTGITHSTDDGEANSTEIAFNYGLPVEVKSGNTTLGYTYDYTRRKTAVTVNGATQATYTYKDYTYNTNQNKCTFGEQTTVLNAGSGGATTILQSKTGVLDSASGRIKATEIIKIDGSEKYRKEYDVNGRLTSAKDSVSGTRTYTYDNYDNVTNISGGGLTENYTYNAYGELTQKTLTGAVTQTYSYTYKNNAARDLDYITYGNYKFKPLTDVNCRNTGREIYSGNNKVAGEYITYRKVGDHATNMPATVWFGNGEKIADSIKYKYDWCGNICQITENGHVVAKYTYDSLNRLIREDNKAIGTTTLFTYDNAGNITERCVYDYTSKSGEELEEIDCKHFSYDYEGDKLVNCNGETFAYNNLGNPTIYSGNACEWQYGTRLTKFGDTTFAYNGLGRRTSKGSTTFTYDNDGRLIKQTDDTDVLEFIYDNSGLAGLKYNSTQYFYRKDTQGNIVAILDSNGSTVVKYVYDAWGNHAVIDENDNDVTDGIGALNPFRYRGYYYDTETGLYYLQTRYYDPEIGRFISQDSIEYADPETINGLNLYAYCGNNPVMNIDPMGNAWWNWFISGLQVALGVALCFVPGGQGIGVGLIVGGGLGLIANSVSPTIGQAIGGAASIANGWGAFSTGMSLLGLGAPGLIGGGLMMFIGGATMLFGANEIATAVTGENAIKNITGMSDKAYGWAYFGLNAASSIGQIAGNIYGLHVTREVRLGYSNNVKGFRYYNKKGDLYFDFDYPHGNIKNNHFHGWNGAQGRTSDHMSYLELILWLFRRNFK